MRLSSIPRTGFPGTRRTTGIRANRCRVTSKNSTSYYQDRGYANFEVESTQVAIAPEKDDIFVTINLREGEVYTVGEVKLAGTMKVPEADLKRLLLVQTGQTYSRKLITQTQELMSFRLGADGYAFAKIDPVPTSQRRGEDHRSDVLRRLRQPRLRATHQLHQYERDRRRVCCAVKCGRWRAPTCPMHCSSDRRSACSACRTSRRSNSRRTPVAGTPDLVDVDFDIKEGLPGQFTGGIGYSEAQSFILNGSFVHSNFMGSGERVALELLAGQYSQQYSLSNTDPYTNIDGVSRTIGLQYRDVTQFVSAASDFSTTTISGNLEYGYPISEFQGFRFGLIAQRSDLIVNPQSSAPEAVAWVRNNGNPYTQVIEREINVPGRGRSVRSSRRSCSAASSTPSNWSPAGITTRATARSSRTAVCSIH